MSSAWAQFEANLRKELGRGGPDKDTAPKEITSAASHLKKNDLFLFGSGSVSNLLVVSCHECGALLKPAFLAHHIRKVHPGPVQTQGSSSSSTTSPVISTTRHSTPPKPHPQRFKPPLPPNNRIEQLIREEEGFIKSNTPKSKNSGRVSLNVSSSNKLTKKNPKKERDRKKGRTRHPKMSVEDKESDSVIRNAMSHVASPPPSPPSLYPSPPRLTKPQRKATKREINAELKNVEPKEEFKLKPGVFNFKSLLQQLPTISKNAFLQRIPEEVTREHRNGLMYQHQRPRPLGTSHYGGRSMGAGQLVFTRRSDNLRAALNNILPSQRTYECTCEIKSQDASTSENNVVSTDYTTDSQGPRSQRLEEYSDSFSSSRQTSPGVDKLLDIFDPDILEKSFSDDFLSDSFSWTDYADPGKLSNKLFAPPGANKPNIPKLKVDTNQIKSNSAMAVFEFDDPEEGRRAKEEERMRLMRTGASSSGRKNKRKITKSPSQASTPKNSTVNGNFEQPSPSTSTFSSKRGRYEVIELDPSPTPPSTSPIKHCVASPRQFSYMVGYGEQSAT